jgi:hypothetical protein
MNLLFFLILFIKTLIFSNKIQTRILHTSIHSNLPNIKLHHIVVLTNPSLERSVYSIDFSPKNQLVYDLLSGKTIPGEIRIRYIKNATLYDDDKIIKSLEINIAYEESLFLSNKIYSGIKDEKIKKIIEKAKTWDQNKMNLYTRNCQHFSAFVLKNVGNM